MAQATATATSETAHGSTNSGKELCLLSLDGGGVRDLSSLQILKQLMELFDPKNPPKPCECFDMIGGTSTGGLIAIMLGRLRLSVNECIEEYKALSGKAFTTVPIVSESKAGFVVDLSSSIGEWDSDHLTRQGLFKNELVKSDGQYGCNL